MCYFSLSLSLTLPPSLSLSFGGGVIFYFFGLSNVKEGGCMCAHERLGLRGFPGGSPQTAERHAVGGAGVRVGGWVGGLGEDERLSACL